ncbi:uncharacterized protein H6S33_010217 [Morchella sextelata]|uniref:uncharacterized protein n=1 Tax=Morchella sextelata TaxID=1174677 RepID=UPI001D055E82|nr:uncharacterized protein H6S33_010217 [Morchella sextelata]KAH0612165.1 hypothetical protein H6S33_010217 [Morchella sextelata]
MASIQEDPVQDRPTEERQRLKEHFSIPLEQHGDKWSELWNNGELPWDKGAPNPALVDLLAQWEEHDFFRSQDALKTRRRALVPGCGRGYDTSLLSTYGYDAFGLDISETAIKAASEWVSLQSEEEKNTQSKHSFEMWGQSHIVLGDFFRSDWAEKVHFDLKGGFDLVYDYTFLCALHPTLRSKWAARMAELIAPQHGLLICLEFPLYKPPETGGPPWGLTSKIYDELLGDNFKKALFYKPERTHKVGQGSDYVSVWRRK